MAERDIIHMIQAREERGAEELLKHYGPLMRYIIAPIVDDPQDREECLSEAALKVWDKIDLFHPERGSWTAWLTALTRNTALNKARRQQQPLYQEDMAAQLPSREAAPEEALLQQESRAELGRALSLLSAKDRSLFYRKYYYRQATAQIASELGLTERAVEGRLYRIKKRLRETLGGEGHD